MPIIDPRTEEPTRDMLGHAIRGEMQELSLLIRSVGDERYRQALGLCVTAAACIAVDVAGRWPTDADVREIARLVSQGGTEIPLDEADVYDYLSGAALGFKPLPQAIGDDMAAATLPLFITGTLLFAYRPEGKKWWDYLDQIWSAYEKAGTLDVSVLPALQVRARMIKAAAEQGTASDLALRAVDRERDRERPATLALSVHCARTGVGTLAVAAASARDRLGLSTAAEFGSGTLSVMCTCVTGWPIATQVPVAGPLRRVTGGCALCAQPTWKASLITGEYIVWSRGVDPARQQRSAPERCRSRPAFTRRTRAA